MYFKLKTKTNLQKFPPPLLSNYILYAHVQCGEPKKVPI